MVSGCSSSASPCLCRWSLSMGINQIRTSKLLVPALGLALILAGAPPVFGQIGRQEPASAPATRDRTLYTRPVPSGSKMKFKGVVIRRDADTFVLRDRNRVDYQVLLTDDTSIRTHGGFFRRGRKYAVTDILSGLIVEVEGRGDQQGQLVADKVRFDESDMRAAITAETRVGPVEENQKRMAGQMDELYAVAAEARAEVNQAHERISALDDYDVQESAIVTFRVNSA